MKLIMAVIRPQALDRVRDALTEIGVEGMTVCEVKGYGRQRGHTEVYRGAEYRVDFMPKLKLEIAVTADRAEAVIIAIRDAANMGKIGDGKLFVLDLENVVRVRTGETGAAAL